MSNEPVFSASRSLGATFAALALFVASASARRQDGLPTFEVVSIKPNVSLNPQMAIRLPPGGVNGVNVTPQLLMRYAFELPDSRIADVPDWARNTRYDIVAKAPASAANEDMRPMIRALLRDRFKLVTREEARPMQVHVLTREAERARGPRLVPASGACANRNSSNKSGALSTDERCGLSIAFGRFAVATFRCHSSRRAWERSPDPSSSIAPACPGRSTSRWITRLTLLPWAQPRPRTFQISILPVHRSRRRFVSSSGCNGSR